MLLSVPNFMYHITTLPTVRCQASAVVMLTVMLKVLQVCCCKWPIKSSVMQPHLNSGLVQLHSTYDCSTRRLICWMLINCQKYCMALSAVDAYDWVDRWGDRERDRESLLLSWAMVFGIDKLSCYQCCTVLWNALRTSQLQFCTGMCACVIYIEIHNVMCTLYWVFIYRVWYVGILRVGCIALLILNFGEWLASLCSCFTLSTHSVGLGRILTLPGNKPLAVKPTGQLTPSHMLMYSMWEKQRWRSPLLFCHITQRRLVFDVNQLHRSGSLKCCKM
jgi:hypothetical protein